MTLHFPLSDPAASEFVTGSAAHACKLLRRQGCGQSH
jgi:hypothetical protein